MVVALDAGKAGLTTAQFAAGARCSDSIHKLRHGHGLRIETERVGYGGISSGEPAICGLSSPVRGLELVPSSEMRARKLAVRSEEGAPHVA